MYVAYEGQVLLCLKRIRIQAHYGKPAGPGSEIAWCTDHIVDLVKKLYDPDTKFPARPAAQPFLSRLGRQVQLRTLVNQGSLSSSL